MSAAVAIANLGNLVRDLEFWIKELIDARCTEDEISALSVMGGKLADATTFVQKKTGTFTPVQRQIGQQVWAASEKLRSQGHATIASLTKGDKLQRVVVFRRNIELIFTGPTDRILDSEAIKARKLVTRHRCEEIRKLNPYKIVIWAASYAPTLWTGGQMGQGIFECLIYELKSASVQTMPLEIQETLQILKTDGPLSNSVYYDKFLGDFLGEQIAPELETDAIRTADWNPGSRGSTLGLYDGMVIIPPVYYMPLEFYKFSGLNTEKLDEVCSYLPRSLKTSCLWDGGPVTNSFGIGFPRNPLEDAIVVMSMNQNAGSELLQFIAPLAATTTTSSLHGPNIQQVP